MRRPRPVPAGRLRPTGRSPPRRRHRPSPPAVRAAAPIADRDAAPAGGAGPGRSSVPGPGGWTRPPTVARGQPRTLAAAGTGKMQTRAWVISLVVGGLENLRPPHGPCPPYPPSSEHLLSDFDAALGGGEGGFPAAEGEQRLLQRRADQRSGLRRADPPAEDPA